MKPQPLDIVAEVAARYHLTADQVLKPNSPFTRLVRRQAIIAIWQARPKFETQQMQALFSSCRDASRTLMRKHEAGEIPPLPPVLDPRELIKSYAALRRGSVRDIMGRDQFAETLSIRWGCIRHVHALCPHLSSVELGRLFGVHHTTILYVCRRSAKSRRVQTVVDQLAA